MANINYNLIPIQSVIPEIPSKSIPHVHTDKWLLYKSNYANDVYDWFKQTIKTKPNTFSISGVVSDINDNPISGVIVESGKTHFTTTNKNGEYILEGLIKGNRKISVYDNKNQYIVQTQKVNLESNNKKIDFMITNY